MADVSLKQNPTLVDVQQYVEAVVVARGFGTQTVEQEFILLCEEVGELAKALRKATGGRIATDSAEVGQLEHEAADVLWMLIAVCNKLDIDLEQALRAKEEKNKKREWK